MLQIVETSDSNESTWKSSQGTLIVLRPEPEVLVFVEEGHLDDRFAPHIATACNAALECPKPLHVFVDCNDLISYAPAIRKQPTEWLLANRDRVVKQHMLARSPLTQMGLSVASLVLGRLIKSHSSRASFNAALDATLRHVRGAKQRSDQTGWSAVRPTYPVEDRGLYCSGASQRESLS